MKKNILPAVNNDGSVVITDYLCGYNEISCAIHKDTGDNGSALFSLKIKKGGQVLNGCNLKMYGPCERKSFVRFMKKVLLEIKKIDKHEK